MLGDLRHHASYEDSSQAPAPMPIEIKKRAPCPIITKVLIGRNILERDRNLVNITFQTPHRIDRLFLNPAVLRPGAHRTGATEGSDRTLLHERLVMSWASAGEKLQSLLLAASMPSLLCLHNTTTINTTTTIQQRP